jgi:hypothetical protein
MQGDNFDAPNRLFYSLEVTFNNISFQRGDVRELIPEFFYLPEMFLNINNIDYGITSPDKIKIDDCIMPNDNKGETIEKFCIFINEMIRDLEKANDNDISSWLKIIFGNNQKSIKYNNKKRLYFKSQCYIDKDSNDFSTRIKDNFTLDAYDLGIVPLKTIIDDKTFHNRKQDFMTGNFITFYNNKDNLNIIKNLKYENIKNTKNLIKWYIDEIDLDDIKSCRTNKFLNMVATCSFDGVISVYIKPNKLISIIKDPNGSCFDKVFLCSNPFPCVIAVKYNRYLISYSKVE